MYTAIQAKTDHTSRSALVTEAATLPSTAALFVDFDNIYLALGGAPNANHAEQPSSAAQSFATHPERWLAWIADGMPGYRESDSYALQPRSVLIRRCYLNPGRFGRSRTHFVRTAFSVIDCPFLSGHTKNSADIHMVMDILDTLEHPTHFDEFIIFSGDSDFTPVLLRLRAHNRRTTILTIGRAVEAYKAAADRVIDGDTFIASALDFGQRPELRLVSSSKATCSSEPIEPICEYVTSNSELIANLALSFSESDLNEAIISVVQQLLADAPASISLALLGGELHKAFGGQIKETNWAGAGSLKKLLDSAAGPKLAVATGPNNTAYVFDPTRQPPPANSK
jgi:hypothetical protein